MHRTKTAARAITAALTIALALPTTAFADVIIDDVTLSQGDNEVGGGVASLIDSTLGMVNVVAENIVIDEDLTINFEGGNDIENVDIQGDATVEMNFCDENGENEVEDTSVRGTSTLVMNLDDDVEVEEIKAYDQATVEVNVTGEVEAEEIVGNDDATITVRGTDCQKKDVISIGDDEEDSQLMTTNGNLTIDHVTVEMEAKENIVGSLGGNVTIDSSKIENGDDVEHTDIFAGGTLEVRESVIDIEGTMLSEGMMTIEHSDVEIERADSYNKDLPLVWSKTGIRLIGEENGELKDAVIDGTKVITLDTGDKDKVDLEADGDPAYEKCKSDDDDSNRAAKRVPSMGDVARANVGLIAAAGIALAGLGWGLKRKAE